MDARVALELLRAMRNEGVAFKVVGAVALAFQGLPRATEDLDVFVEPTHDNIARLRAALHAVFEDPSIDEITAEDLLGDYPAVQYVPPDPGFHVDILTRLGEAFTYDDIEAEQREVEGIEVPVATARMLHRMKRDTVRPKDRLDAALLRERFGPEVEG